MDQRLRFLRTPVFDREGRRCMAVQMLLGDVVVMQSGVDGTEEEVAAWMDEGSFATEEGCLFRRCVDFGIDVLRAQFERATKILDPDEVWMPGLDGCPEEGPHA